MSRQNPLYAALQTVLVENPDWEGIQALLNSQSIAKDYNGNIFSYKTIGRRRTIYFEFPVTQYVLSGTNEQLLASFHYDMPFAITPAFKLFVIRNVLIEKIEREGWRPWIVEYLRNQRDWTPHTTALWTGYCIAHKLSDTEQKAVLATFPHKHERFTYQICAITHVRVATTVVVPEYLRGNLYNGSGLSDQVFPLFSRHPIQTTMRYVDSLAYELGHAEAESSVDYLYIGWVPRNTPPWPARLRTNIQNIQTPYIPDIPIVRALFPHQCDACSYYVESTTAIGGNKLCFWCVKDRYPNLEIKAYSTNALVHVKIQLATLKPAPHTIFPSRALMGCELEYNCSSQSSLNSRVRLLTHLSGFVIFKHDGSLSSGGFEIVTAPADITLHKIKFAPVFAEFPATLKTGNNTGMHIHLDRKATTPLMLGRMVEFLNNPDNKEFLETIGERTFNTYCNQTGLNYRSVLDKQGGARYTTLNILPAKTVEFRFFKAPITYESFVKNLEFVIALLQYFRTGMTTVHPKEGKKISCFMDFLKQHNRSKLEARNENHYLMAFLKDRQVF